MSGHSRAVQSEGERQAWGYAMDDCDRRSDSGCDSADEFVPVGDLEALRSHLASGSKDEDMNCSDSVGADKSGVVSSSDEWTGYSSPEGSSGAAGSAEGDLSDGSLCSSTEELATAEGTDNSSTAFSAEGDDSARELPEVSSSQDPEKQPSAAYHRGAILTVMEEGTFPDGEPQYSARLRYIEAPWEMPAMLLIKIRQVEMGQEDD